MRSSSSGPFATLLMLVPLVAVPLLAVFGIPDFSPLSASPSKSESDVAMALRTDVGVSARHSADDLFAPISMRDGSPSGGIARPEPGRAQDAPPADDPFSPSEFSSDAENRRQPPSDQRAPSSPGTGRPWTPPANRIEGWALADGQQSAAESSNGAPSRQRAQTAANDTAQGFVRNALEQQNEASRGHQAGRGEQPSSGAGEESRLGQTGGLRQEQFGAVSRGFRNLDENARPPFNGQPPLLSERMLATNPTIGEAARGNNSAPARPHHAEGDRASATPEESSVTDSPMTWRGAIEWLNRHGIRHYQLQPGQNPNEFHFSCSFTPEDNPRITHRFEAEAGEPLRAVEKVIRQVEKWHHGSESPADAGTARADKEFPEFVGG